MISLPSTSNLSYADILKVKSWLSGVQAWWLPFRPYNKLLSFFRSKARQEPSSLLLNLRDQTERKPVTHFPILAKLGLEQGNGTAAIIIKP